MNRAEIVKICEAEVLSTAARLFGMTQDRLNRFADYEGCANLVYEYERDERPLILRISFRPERPAEQVQAELHFINYLADNGVRVSRPLLSQNGNLVETIQADGIPFVVVSFVKGRGMRVPDNEYRYREGVPIDEYFQNWGRALGQMHALSKKYVPMSATIKRPEWFELDSFTQINERVPESLPVVREKFKYLLGRLAALPKDRDSYGLIHRDFNDGNFTVDYDNGDMTIFDFDDACYFWFMYELACAWEGGIGRTMFRPLDKRQAFMDRYMEQVLEGYDRENALSAEWLERLPLFLQVIQMEEFLHYVQYLDGPGDEIKAGLNYKRRCIEGDIPYLGFFDSIYSPDQPFALETVPVQRFRGQQGGFVQTTQDALHSTPTMTTAPSPMPAPVTLEYIGNSCILITAPDGTRIVSDPYHDFPRPPGLDPLPSDLKADAVTVSHSHPDHNNAEAVAGTPQVLTGSGTCQVGMVKVIGYEGREGSPSGPSDNPHVVFVFEIGEIKIVQMGDSGPITQPDVLAAIENADVLLANIDGYVIPPEQIMPFVQRAKVRTFIPMHYSLRKDARWCDAPTIQEFLKTLPSDLAVVREGSKIQVGSNMPKQVTVLMPLALVK